MKNLLICLMLFGGILSFLSGCEKMNELEISDFKEVCLETNTFEFFYKDKKYVSQYYLNSDSTVVFQNLEVEKISESLSEISGLVTFIREDGTVEYFDSLKDLKNKQSLKSSVLTMQIGFQRYFRIYEDTDFHGKRYEFTSSISIPDLGVPYDMNDKISSAQINTRLIEEEPPTGPVYPVTGHWEMIFYEGFNYTGNMLFFTTEVQSIVDIPSFKKYPLYPGSHRNWNDQASSFKIRLVQ